MKTTTILGLAEALAQGPPPAGNLAIPIHLDDAIEVEIYAPQGEDEQQPHDRDEAYIVASGSGTFFDGSARHAVSPGTFLFVPAHQPHRFEQFSADFAVWVFFFGPVR